MHGKLIANRRRVENAYKDMDMSIQTTKKIYQMADFENKTTAKIENKMKMVN